MYAHERSIVHPDIKPGNIFLLSDGTVKLLDFGLAWPGGAENPLTGTPCYMPPGQVECLPVDERADIFAPSLTAFEIVILRAARFQGHLKREKGNSAMLNLQKIKIEYTMDQLSKAYERNYSNLEQQLGNIIVWSAHLALENIANSDALYHNVEHTVMAALAGQAIVEGRHLSEGGVMPRDWAHFIIALLFHDIGYVKGICKADRGYTIATGVGQETVEMPPGSTDAALAPYHVERSKMFVRERFGPGVILKGLIDSEVITSYIEMTRFPVPDDDWYQDTHGYRGLLRAADFIGQLGDPNRLQKCTALFYEFEELGLNAKLGYKRPGDLRMENNKFYWDVVSPYVQDALRYLRVTQDGKQWIANLQANVFGQGIMSETASHCASYPR